MEWRPGFQPEIRPDNCLKKRTKRIELPPAPARGRSSEIPAEFLPVSHPVRPSRQMFDWVSIVGALSLARPTKCRRGFLQAHPIYLEREREGDRERGEMEGEMEGERGGEGETEKER